MIRLAAIKNMYVHAFFVVPKKKITTRLHFLNGRLLIIVNVIIHSKKIIYENQIISISSRF